MAKKTGWATVSPQGIGNDDGEFGTASRNVEGEKPMFWDVDTLKQCMHEVDVGGTMQRFMKTLEVPGYEVRIGASSIKRKGNYYIQIQGSVTFVDDSHHPTLRFPQTWTIEVDLWGLVRGYRDTYDSYEDLDDEQGSQDNHPDQEDSLSVQLDPGTGGVDKVQDELKEALEAYLYPWASSASREATVIRVQWQDRVVATGSTPT